MKRVYTRKGDRGVTTLPMKYPSGAYARASKGSTRISAMSQLDHASSFVTLAMFSVQDYEHLLNDLAFVHGQLSKANVLVACAGHPLPLNAARITSSDVKYLEEAIDRLSEEVCYPTKCSPGSYTNFMSIRLNLARTALRIAEVHVTMLVDSGVSVNGSVLSILNRMSDYMYVASLWVEQNTPQGEGARD